MESLFGNLVFDSWENKTLTRARDDAVIIPMLMEFSRKAMAADPSIGRVNIGTGGNTPESKNYMENDSHELMLEGTQYPDSSEQHMLLYNKKIKLAGEQTLEDEFRKPDKIALKPWMTKILLHCYSPTFVEQTIAQLNIPNIKHLLERYPPRWSARNDFPWASIVKFNKDNLLNLISPHFMKQMFRSENENEMYLAFKLAREHGISFSSNFDIEDFIAAHPELIVKNIENFAPGLAVLTEEKIQLNSLHYIQLFGSSFKPVPPEIIKKHLLELTKNNIPITPDLLSWLINNEHRMPDAIPAMVKIREKHVLNNTILDYLFS